jgi:hypothetical protein
MEYDLMEGTAVSRHYVGIIRRILRGASMTGDYAAEPPTERHLGLESVKKTLQVVWVGTGTTVAPAALINIDPLSDNPELQPSSV